MNQNYLNAQVNWDALVATYPLTASISINLRARATQVVASSGELLFRIGDPIRHIYFVISGEVRLMRFDRNGGEVILQRSRAGFIAEASLDSPAYHCDAVVTETSTLLLFPIAAFQAALESEPDFRKAWQSRLAKELRKVRAQCERLSLNNAADRVTHYIESEGVDGVITLNHSRKSWASELGLTHEALYRALRRMQDDGILKVEGKVLYAIN